MEKIEGLVLYRELVWRHIIWELQEYADGEKAGLGSVEYSLEITCAGNQAESNEWTGAKGALAEEIGG